MTASKHSLKICLFYTHGDLPVARSLSERLMSDGVDVNLFEFAALEMRGKDQKNARHWREKRREVQNAIQDASAILFCLSEQFIERTSLRSDWQFVLDAAANTRHGNISVLPIRLDECNVPQSLERWLSIDLFEEGGYEKLMLAVKFQADMEKVELEFHPGWKEKFVYPEIKPESDEEKILRPSLGWVVSLAIILFAAIYLFKTINNPASRAQFVPVEVLAENATKNAQSVATNRAGTVTAGVLSISVPLSQTAAYRTAVPLTQTKAEFEAHITPTVTITPTITLTPTYTLTVVSIPVQVIGVGNVSMVLVTGGNFTMGNDGSDNASPAVSMDLEPYYIDQFEVTTAQYQKCVQAGVCKPPAKTDSQTRPNYYGPTIYANYPVINVDWNMARTFCEWRAARLPTEAEWEKAARGTEPLSYPWGEGILCPFANYTAPEGACIGDTQPVDKYEAGRSRYNVYNMAGNVTEWVGDLYLPYPYRTSDDRDNPASSGPRVVRGGSWASPPEELLTYHRISLDPASFSISGNDLGFRCARDANP